MRWRTRAYRIGRVIVDMPPIQLEDTILSMRIAVNLGTMGVSPVIPLGKWTKAHAAVWEVLKRLMV